jgi:hypothetical protein
MMRDQNPGLLRSFSPASAGLLAIWALSFLITACTDQTFPVDSAKTATSIRVTRPSRPIGSNVQEITDPAALQRVFAVVRQYNSWEIYREGLGACEVLVVEWISAGQVRAAMGICDAGHSARVGDQTSGADSGRRVPDRDAAELLSALGGYFGPK